MAPLIDQLKAILPKILDVTTGLIKESENSLCGPCPKCGGEDRFVYKTDSGKFWCRQCRPAENTPPGDIIDFHKWLNELTTSDLIKKYFPKDEQGQKEPGKKESPTELWASIIQKYTNDNPVYRLFSNRRKINKNAVSQVFAQGKVRFFKHRGKEAVACAFRELDGDQNVLAVQCLSVDEKAFSYTDKNKVFTKDSKASESCFFQAGTEIKKANQIIICEAVINAISGAECMPDACFLALGGSTLYKKVKALRKYRDNGKQIICFFDNDEAGRKATRSVANLLGVKTKSVKWSKNAPDGQDINDLLKAGEHKTIIEMVNNAKPVKIERSSTSKDERKPTIADSLVLLAKENVHFFFCDQLDTPYARFSVKDHFEHWPIRSKSFRVWLQGLYYKAENKGANSDAMSQALDTLEAIAKFDGKGSIELNIRVCEHDGAYWYDLSNERWQAVKITGTGWQVIDDPPVLFRRLAHQKPQALPDCNGSIDALRPFLEGIEKLEHKDLVTVWLISCFLPGFPHTILVPYGDQGSGKTTISKNCKQIIDPSLIDTLGLVGEQRELVQTLSHHWLLPYDNLSSLSREVQNIFCRTITGASYCKRKLYSDEEDIITKNRNCLIISGINYPATAPDLLDRCILIKLKRFSNSGQNKKDAVLEKKFQAALPAILGGMFNVASKAMRIKNNVNLSVLPRMADFAEWGYAIAEAAGFGGQNFLTTYRENTELRNQEIISANPIANAIMDFMKSETEWEGTSSELLDGLKALTSEGDQKSKAWPKSSNVLTRRLNELKTNLAEAGIKFEINRTNEGRSITLNSRQEAGENTVTTVTTVTSQQNQQVMRDDMVTTGDGKEKIPSPLKPLKSIQNDDSDDSDDIFPSLLEDKLNDVNVADVVSKSVEIEEGII